MIQDMNRNMRVFPLYFPNNETICDYAANDEWTTHDIIFNNMNCLFWFIQTVDAVGS